MHSIIKSKRFLNYSLYFIFLLFMVSCSSSKISKDYEGLNLMDLKAKQNQLLKELSYFKMEFYLNRVEKGKSRYSLASIEDKNLKSIMENAKDDDVFVKNWKEAVKRFSDFEDANSFEIREHRINYRTRFETQAERDNYYDTYWKLSNNLKREKFEEYTIYYDDFNKKLNLMWLNRGWYLLEYHKKKNLAFPIDWLKYQDYEGIGEELTYKDLTQRIKYLDKKIKRLI